MLAVFCIPQAEEGAAGVTPLHERRIRLEKNLAALSMQIDDVFKLVDGIEGDEVIIAARRQQVRWFVPGASLSYPRDMFE